jgi:hypothetical protein
LKILCFINVKEKNVVAAINVKEKNVHLARCNLDGRKGRQNEKSYSRSSLAELGHCSLVRMND